MGCHEFDSPGRGPPERVDARASADWGEGGDHADQLKRELIAVARPPLNLKCWHTVGRGSCRCTSGAPARRLRSLAPANVRSTGAAQQGPAESALSAVWWPSAPRRSRRRVPGGSWIVARRRLHDERQTGEGPDRTTKAAAARIRTVPRTEVGLRASRVPSTCLSADSGTRSSSVTSLSRCSRTGSTVTCCRRTADPARLNTPIYRIPMWRHDAIGYSQSGAPTQQPFDTASAGRR